MKTFYLLLNLSIEPFSFALADQETIFFEKKQSGDYSFTENIIHDIDSTCKNYNLTLSDCSGIGVINGPGSYTGTRIAVATANTLAQINKCPVFGFNCIDVLAESLQPLKQVIICAIPSRKNELTFSMYSAGSSDHKMTDNLALKEDAFFSFLKQFNHDISLIGPLSNNVIQSCNDLEYISAHYKDLSLSALLPLLLKTLQTNTDHQYVKPLYLHSAV